MEPEVLKELGLSEGEVRVYYAMLSLGNSSINQIHEKTGIERRNIYDILNKLIGKGLVSYIVESGKRTYQCAPPVRLLDEIKNREDALRKVRELVPEITRIYEGSKPDIRAEIYRGKDGLKAVFEDMLNYSENYFIGGGWYVIKKMPFYWIGYNRKRMERGVRWYNLVRHEFQKTKIPEKRLVSVRFLPEEFSGSPNAIFIYGNKTANVLWGAELFAFVIESKEIAENYMKYHKYLWDNVARNGAN